MTPAALQRLSGAFRPTSQRQSATIDAMTQDGALWSWCCWCGEKTLLFPQPGDVTFGGRIVQPHPYLSGRDTSCISCNRGIREGWAAVYAAEWPSGHIHIDTEESGGHLTTKIFQSSPTRGTPTEWVRKCIISVPGHTVTPAEIYGWRTGIIAGHIRESQR